MGLRLQIFLGMLAVVLLALFGTGFVAYYHYQSQEIAYNKQRLLRKEAALGRSLDYVLSRHGGDLPEDSISIVFTDRICELADVHGLIFSLYRPDGVLITTSATFTEQDLQPSLVLNPNLLRRLNNNENSVIEEETLGEQKFVRVHWTVKNFKNQPLLIASARYNPRPLDQGGIKLFLNKLAPFYFTLFIGAMMIAYLLVQSIVKPLHRLKVEMAKVDPLGISPPLKHKWNDEIGALVEEYNKLLEKLRSSIESRAKDEREGAWREMAQQVAHEIKNPLTPLRLGIQQLERSWNDGVDDFPVRLKRFTATAISQIDVLTAIAEDFALLAIVREAEHMSVNLGEIVKNAAGLYGYESVEVQILTENIMVIGDSSRLIRAFNNLIANALDSMYEAGSADRIKIVVSDEGGFGVVQVIDKGMGISENKLERIFEPRFTTKTHGLGLGLAMVRSIVEQARGKVSVESKEGEGATFKICLRKA